jgi:hypothetical protein
METIKEGELARLPDGQLVKVESVADGYATVLRIDGEREGTRAVCSLNKLGPV